MEGVENPQIVKYREIMYDGNYDGRYMFTSLLIQNLGKYMCIYFLLHRVCKYSY